MATSYDNFEVIVADNASTDDSVAFLTSHYPGVRIIRLDKNHGFAIGYNLALKQVDAPYYVLLNSDVEVTPGWVAPIVSMMEADKKIAAAQPKILMEKNRNVFEYAGAAGGWLDHLGYPFARGRVFDVCETDAGQYDDESDIFWASGAALFVRSQVYHECGGLDEYFFAHQEEIDLCWRMQLAGHRIRVCPKSVVYHVGGGTLPKGNERKVYLNFRNNLIMMSKNLPLRQSLWKIPYRLLLDAVSAWKSLFAGEGIYFIAILEAHLSVLKWMAVSRSNSIFPVSRRGKLRGMYMRSIVWQHFIKGRTKFSELSSDK